MRKSPSQSATLYKINTKKDGIDGNKWIVVETSNGVKRWKLFKKQSKKPSKKSSKLTKKSLKKVSREQDINNNKNILKITNLGLLFLDFIENEDLFPKSPMDIKKFDKNLKILWKTLLENGYIGIIPKNKYTHETYYIDGKDWVYLANIALEIGNRKKYYYEPAQLTNEGKKLIIQKLKNMKLFE